MLENAILVTIFVLLALLGGLFSGAETGMYQLSRLRLRLGIEKKRLPFVVLGRCLHDSPGLLLAMLIGTNLANYVGTSIITRMFLARAATEAAAELYATAVAVPILFVVSEVIPKNLFFFRADALMPYVSPVLYVFHRVLTWCGVVPLLKLLSALFTKLTGLAASSKTVITSIQRHKVAALLRETHEEGLLSTVQNEILGRLVGIPHVRLKATMIPMHAVETIDIGSDYAALMGKLSKCAFTRLPVVEGRPDNVIGFVNVYEALTSSESFTHLRDFVKPIRRLDADIAVTEAMTVMQAEHAKIVLVTKGAKERPIGIVTMKDLAEELLGELAEW